MLLELLIAITGGLLAIIVIVCLIEAIKAQLTWWRFKKLTRGLPMSDGRNIFCNHAIRWGLCRNISTELPRFNRSIGSPPTAGWLLGNKFAACTTDPELMKRIVLDEPNKNINRSELQVPLAELVEDTIMLAHDDQWRRLRKAVAPALRANKFKAPNVVSEIEGSICKLIDSIERRFSEQDAEAESGIQVEVDELVHRYSLNNVFSCFYKQYNLIDFKASYCHWTRMVDEGLEGTIKNPMVRLGMMVGPLRRIVDWAIWNFHTQGQWRREILDFIRLQLRQSIGARRQLARLKTQGKAVDNEDDFLLDDGTRFKRNMADHITDHLLDGKISEREFLSTSSFLVAAGDKTVADALVHTLYQLAVNPEVQRLARASVQADGSEAKYLGWIISESLRLMPPAPISCSRTVAEDTEIEQGRYLLPAGTLVIYPNFLIHRLEKYWGADADEFKPERWRDTSHHHPLQYVPFGAGVRRCPGREFALFEMKELLTRLLLRYKFQCAPKADAYTFDSPFLTFLVFKSPTFVIIKRLETEVAS